jgi:hypothetical protein
MKLAHSAGFTAKSPLALELPKADFSPMHEKEQFFSTLTRERQIGTFLCMRLV